MQALILKAWQHKNLFYYLVLLPSSWLFFLLIQLRRWLYRHGCLSSHKLSVPVVIVGNINVGGSGKTPIVIWLVEQLKQHGYQPGVISRGYGRHAKGIHYLNQHSTPSEAGDEPLLIYQRSDCPVVVGADRVMAGKALLSAHPECDVIICDDGLQHYRLQRDIEIAVVDAQVLHKKLLPAGPMREPVARLASVDFIISRDQVNVGSTYPMQLHADLFYNLLQPEQKVRAGAFNGKQISAIAGIGQPDKFFQQLAAMGLTVEEVPFPDHHAYTSEDLDAISCEILLMTEKDAVKCRRFAKKHYWVLPASAIVQGDLMVKLIASLNQLKQDGRKKEDSYNG